MWDLLFQIIFCKSSFWIINCKLLFRIISCKSCKFLVHIIILYIVVLEKFYVPNFVEQSLPGQNGTLFTTRCYVENIICQFKHCQRHNGAESCVHITSSNTNLDQISSSESRPSIKFKISNKYRPLQSWPNLASESRPRFNLDSTLPLQNISRKNRPNSSFKSCLNFNFKILTKLCALSLKKA